MTARVIPTSWPAYELAVADEAEHDGRPWAPSIHGREVLVRLREGRNMTFEPYRYILSQGVLYLMHAPLGAWPAMDREIEQALVARVEPYAVHGDLLVEQHRIDGELTVAPAPDNRAPIRRPIQGSLFGGFA